VGLGKGVGVAVSIGFNDIGTGERVVVGVGGVVGTGVDSATVGVADGAGAVVSDSGDLEHEKQIKLIRVRRAASRVFILRTIQETQSSIKLITKWPIVHAGAFKNTANSHPSSQSQLRQGCNGRTTTDVRDNLQFDGAYSFQVHIVFFHLTAGGIEIILLPHDVMENRSIC